MLCTRFVYVSPRISYFSKETWFLLLENSIQAKICVLGLLTAARVSQSRCFCYPILQMQNWRSRITMLVKEEGRSSCGWIVE